MKKKGTKKSLINNFYVVSLYSRSLFEKIQTKKFKPNANVTNPWEYTCLVNLMLPQIPTKPNAKV